MYHKKFDEFDADGSGEIDASELNHLVKELGLTRTEKEIKEMVAKGDEDGSGELSFDEFAVLLRGHLDVTAGKLPMNTTLTTTGTGIAATKECLRKALRTTETLHILLERGKIFVFFSIIYFLTWSSLTYISFCRVFLSSSLPPYCHPADKKQSGTIQRQHVIQIIAKVKEKFQVDIIFDDAVWKSMRKNSTLVDNPNAIEHGVLEEWIFDEKYCPIWSSIAAMDAGVHV